MTDQYGEKVADGEARWPFSVEFCPYDIYGWTDEFQEDFTQQLSRIPANTSIFKIHAFEGPSNMQQFQDTKVYLGDIVLKQPFVTSFWGDTQSFFNHTRFENDLESRPEWLQFLQVFDLPRFCDADLPLEGPVYQASMGCPFEFLFKYNEEATELIEEKKDGTRPLRDVPNFFNFEQQLYFDEPGFMQN